MRRYISVKAVFTVLIWFSLSVVNEGFPQNLGLDEGSVCNDDGGICKVLNDCPLAKQQLMKTKRFHNLDRCGFLGRDEVVCCPPTVDVTTPTTTTTTTKIIDKFPEIINRKSSKACNELIASVSQHVNTLILDGEDAAPGEFPHMAALGYPIEGGSLSWQCGASLITDSYVVTAGHCIINSNRIEPTTVRIGRIHIDDPNTGDAQEFIIKKITVHERFNRKLSIHDIALIEMDRPIIRSTNVHPACLYYKNDDPKGIIATGWGKLNVNADDGSKILQKASLIPTAIKECNDTYTSMKLLVLSDRQLCAKSPPGRNSDTCQGDSGGPLQVESTPGSSIHSIVGITSVGSGCGGSTPGVYTRVFSYLDWIEPIVWPDNK